MDKLKSLFKTVYVRPARSAGDLIDWYDRHSESFAYSATGWIAHVGPGVTVSGANLVECVREHRRVVMQPADITYNKMVQPQLIGTPMTARCECGAAKTGVQSHRPGHSSWCPVVA